MNKFLAVLALTTALTGAAYATQFDTSKVSVEEKSFLVVMISEHTANCPGEPWSLVKDLRLQLMSEIDTTTTIMDEPRQKVARAMDWKGKTSWCATTTDYFLKLNDKLAASPALLPSNAPSRPERVDYSSAPAKADALDSLIKFPPPNGRKTAPGTKVMRSAPSVSRSARCSGCRILCRAIR